ncbi:hypothetical protein ACQPZJ_10170 [Actinoplanes sp. CA-054009]
MTRPRDHHGPAAGTDPAPPLTSLAAVRSASARGLHPARKIGKAVRFRLVGTDIHGAIEVRHVIAEDQASWMHCMELYPLYQGFDDAALACLFGIRNAGGWDPVAAARGLPPDVSATVARDYHDAAEMDAAIGGSTWISWPELRDLDMTVTPSARGILEVRETGFSSYLYYWIDDQWPADLITEYGPPPMGASYGSWRLGTITFTYKKVTRNDVIGPGTGWEHVFAVMRALAQRFGDEGVRLVAWFD